MFISDLKNAIETNINLDNIAEQIKRIGFSVIPLTDFGDGIGVRAERHRFDFLGALNEMADKINAKVGYIAFGAVVLFPRKDSPATSPYDAEREVKAVAQNKHRLITDCSPIVSVSGSAIKEIDYLSLKLAAKEAFSRGDCLESLNRIGFAYVSKKDVSHDIMDPALVNDKTPEFSYLKSLFYRAAKDAAHEMGYEVIGDTITDIILQAVPEFVPVTAVVSDDCNQTGESSCGSMLGSAGDGFAKPNDAECVFQLQRGQNGDWSVAGQTTGMAWLGKDPLYALAAFLGRDDVCRFMEDAERKRKGQNFCLKYRTPDSLPEPGGLIDQFRKLHDSINEYEPLSPPVPQCRELVYQGNTWHSEDVFIVHDNYFGVPRYFTRIYPEVREGDLVFVQLDNGSYQTAFVHEGKFRLHDDCGLVHDNPIVLGVEINVNPE